MFNEVFFDDVFVPDDCLVGRSTTDGGPPGQRWPTSAVFMGSSNTIGSGVVGILKAIEGAGLGEDRLALNEAGELVATGHALAALGSGSRSPRSRVPIRRAPKRRCASCSVSSTTSTSRKWA